MSGISTTTAQSASTFLDSIGVNVHMAYTWTSYSNVGLVENSLAYIGVDNVRDKLLDWSNVQSNYVQLADAGYKFDFVLPVYDPTTVNLTEFVNMVHNFVLAHPGSVSAIEGANEVDLWPAQFDGGTTLADNAALQRALYSAVQSDPVLKNLPIYNTTIGIADASSNQQLGNLSNAADFANEHAYAWDFGTPEVALPYLVGFAKIDAPGLPVVITETGYNTDTSDTYSGVDQTVQAKFTLDTLVDAYKMGVANTYLYELLDELGQPSWGLFNADGTPKLAATALHNFTTILHDPDATLTPATSTLNYGLTNMPTSGNQLLLEKGDGTFDLVLWAEAQIWDPNTQQEVVAPDTKVTVQFDHVEKTVLVYDPMVGTAPIATYTNISQLQIDLTDHPLIIEIPSAAPSSPTIVSVSPDTNIANDGITDVNHLTLTGTADAGDTVQVFDGATQIGTATANASGAWTFATATLADGNHAFTTKATDASGQVSNASAALNVTVDTIAPGAPTVASYSPDSGKTGDGITNVNHVTLSGTAVAGATVEVFDGATQIGTATANASGAWTFATGTLADGNHAFTGKAMDAAGNVSAASAALNVTVDTVAPATPTVASFSPDSGKAGDGITNANHISLAGTAAAGSTVEVFDGATQIGTATANASGAWTFATGTLADGSHGFTTKAMDTAGNLSAASAALNVTVDTVAPGAPVLVSDNSGANNSVNVTGTAEAGSKVSVYEGTTLLGTGVANSGGNWTINTGSLSAGAHDFTATATDAAGNVSVISADLDPVVGAIEMAGSTAPIQIGNNYYLDTVSGGAGPELKLNGAAFTAGMWGGWTLIGAEATATGYEVAFKFGSSTYTVWNTDANGNITTNATGTVSGNSTALESLETSFHQDLNGDGVIGVLAVSASTTTIESQGATALVQSGNNYFFNPVAGGTGPELKYGGAAFTVGSTWGAWTAIGVEATATGYEVAFKIGLDTYTVWNTDANGNITTNATGTVSGSSAALEALETSFNQDLNGDHVVGVPGAIMSTTIESFGSTALVQTGTNYFLNPVAGGAGPELKYDGTAFTASVWGAWTPIGVEATATGYEIAWKIGTDTYTVWNTDANGNITTNATGTVSGSSAALKAMELSFHQDLNGDGVLDTASTVIEASGSLKIALDHVVQPSAIDAGSTLELTGIASGSVTFKAGTGMLVLDQSTQFTGSIIGLTGDGTAAHSDQIDLKDISYGAGTSVSYSGNAAGGVLTVTDAQSHTAHLSLVGNYVNSTFNLSSDGNGGTMVIDPPKDQFDFTPTPTPGVAAASAPAVHVAGDGFVFASGAAGSSSFGGANSALDMHAADNFFHQLVTEVIHEVDLGSVLDHSHVPDFHHFMLH